MALCVSFSKTLISLSMSTLIMGSGVRWSRPETLTPAVRLNGSSSKLPLAFEPNEGQVSPELKFLSRGPDCTLLLGPTKVVFLLRNSQIRMKPVGSDLTPQLEGFDPLSGRSHYFFGSDPVKWRTDVPRYSGVRYKDLWPGVDWIFHGAQGRLEYEFVMAPGADPSRIRLAFEGNHQPKIDAQGDLVFSTALGELRQTKPFVFQQIDGEKRQVEGRYVMDQKRQVGFEVAGYDHRRALVIDPILYSTYFGGSGDDAAGGIAVDGSGNIYLTGSTDSVDFPGKAGALQSTLAGGRDVFVTKLDPTGGLVLYSTYIGGSGRDAGNRIAVDPSGSVYVAGSTSSPNFPATSQAFQRTPGGKTDAFLAKLNPSGSALVYSTYLGGSEDDGSLAVAVDASGSAYVTGFTESDNFPTLGPIQAARGAGACRLRLPTPQFYVFPCDDAFVTKFSPSGAALVYSTYLGGSKSADDLSGIDIGKGIAVDVAGNAYITGQTLSDSFPTTPGALQTAYGGRADAFVAKVNPSGSSLVYSSYLGGNWGENGAAIAVDAAGNAYVAGGTNSDDLPTTPGAFRRSRFAGFDDAFITRINPEGSALVYSTYLGGSQFDSVEALALDSSGSVVVTGATDSKDFPTTPDAHQAGFAGGERLGDAFIARLNAAGAAVLFSTYLGGSADDLGLDVATDASGNAYVTGFTLSRDFPRWNAFQANYGGAGAFATGDAFLAKISGGPLPAPAVVTVSAATFLGPVVAGDSIASAFGQGLAVSTLAVNQLPLPTSLASTSVKIIDSAAVERLAPLYFVSPTQVNYLVPPGSRTGPVRITVSSRDSVVATGTVQIRATAPGVFTADANGHGVAAALAQRITADGSQRYEPVFQSDPATGRNVPVPIDLSRTGEQVYLLLFGTGVRARTALPAVRVRVGGEDAEVLYAGPQLDYPGLDQVNVALPRRWIGRGQVDVILTVDGIPANTVTIAIR